MEWTPPLDGIGVPEWLRKEPFKREGVHSIAYPGPSDLKLPLPS